MRRLLTAIALVSVVMAVSAPVHAQRGAREYRRTIARALREFDGGRYEEARALFRQAHELAPSARTLRGIGMASFELRDYVEAESALSEALLSQTRPLDARQRAETAELLDQTLGFLGRFLFIVDPTAAALTVDDGVPPPRLDGMVLLPIGEHVVRAQLEGYVPEVRRLDVLGGERETIEIQLTPEGAPSVVTEPDDRESLLWPSVVVLASAAAPLAGMLGGVGWLVDRDGELARCRDVTPDLRCLNEDTLASEQAASIGFTVAMGLTAAGLLGVGVVLLVVGLGGDEGAAAARCAPTIGGVACAGRF